MPTRFKSLSKILVITLTLFLSITTFSQETTGSVEGTVLDRSGAPVAGATVTIENEPVFSGFKKSLTTDEKGYFIIAEVPAEMYRITVTKNGFADFSQEIAVTVSKTVKISATLTVPKKKPNPAVREIVRLPSKPTFGSLMKTAPNVRPEVLAAGFQIDGASGAENVFFIDGQEVTNYRTGQLNSNNDLPLELLQEVWIKSGVIPAEYGGALGGIINIITTGGKNQWRGNFGFSLTPQKLQGSPNSILNRFGSGAGQIEYFRPNKDGGTGFFPTATLGGRLVKDKLWFFAAYAPQIYQATRAIDYFTSSNPATRTVSETIEYKANLRTEEAFLRLDYQPNSKLRIFGTFLYNPIIQDGILPSSAEGLGGVPQAVSGLRGADYLATRGGRQNSNIFNVHAALDVTNNFLLNFRAGRGFLNEKLDSYGLPRTTRFLCSTSGNPESVPGSNCFRGFQNISNNFVRDYDVSKRTSFDAEGVIYRINAFGLHNFKFGYQFNRLFNSIKEGYVATGIVNLYYGLSIENLIGLEPTPGNLGSGFLQRFGAVGKAGNVNHSIYAQDSWNIARLSLDLGIRFENEELPDYRNDLKIKFGWKDKIAPRFGFALALLHK